MNRKQIVNWFKSDQRLLEVLTNEDRLAIMWICACACDEMKGFLPEIRKVINTRELMRLLNEEDNKRCQI